MAPKLAMLEGCLILVALVAFPANAARTQMKMTMARRASASYHAEVHRMLQERRKSEAHLKSSVSIETAYDILQKRHQRNASALSLIEEGLSSSKHFQSPRLRRHTASLAQMYGPSQSATQANTILGGMIKDAEMQYDQLHLECQQFFHKQCGLMETCREDISSANSLAAEWRSKVLQAQSEINVCEVRIPRLEDDLATSIRECDKRLGYLRRDLKVVLNDINVMTSVLALTSCTGNFLLQTGRPTLLTCTHPCRNGSFAAIGHAGIHKRLTALQSKEVRQLVQEGLAELAEEGSEEEQGPSGTTAGGTTAAPVTTFENPPLPQQALPDDPCSNIDYDNGEGKGGCVLRATPECYNLQNKFLTIQGETVDKRDELLEEISNLEAACKEAKETLEGEIQMYTTKMTDEHAKLADSTSGENTAAEQGQMKAVEHTQLKSAMMQQRSSCSSKLRTLESEMCALKKIRGEFNKKEGENHPFFQDCEVADKWEEEECSATCGGGVQQLVRAIIVPASGEGAPCPPSSMQQSCNEQPCPIDCKMAPWSGFSACSADCGGGVTERTRRVEVRARYDGKPCGDVEETVPCNMQSCDKDCDLAPWSKWSDCSKECDSGTRTRRRTVEVAAVGRGKCPLVDDAERLERMPCNTQPCPRDATKPLTCTAKVDVVLLLDGSGSMGQSGFDATKSFAKKFVSAFEGAGADATVSVILFSGPYSYTYMRRCVGVGAAVDMANDCKVKMVKHFSSDMGAVKTDIDALQWPMGTTLTSAALEMARSELSLGRDGTQKVVLTITDGIPLSSRSTYYAAMRLKQDARLMFGAVRLSSRGLNYMMKWSSSPVDENVINIKSFQDLDKIDTVDSLIADMCRTVAVPTASTASSGSSSSGSSSGSSSSTR